MWSGERRLSISIRTRLSFGSGRTRGATRRDAIRSCRSSRLRNRGVRRPARRARRRPLSESPPGSGSGHLSGEPEIVFHQVTVVGAVLSVPHDHAGHADDLSQEGRRRQAA